MANKLAEDFVYELFSAILEKRTVLDVAVEHLKFSYLQTEEDKSIWKRIKERYVKTGKIPSIGQLQQYFVEDEEALEKLALIKEIKIREDGGFEEVISMFETFIKQMKFLEANDKIVDSYNKGNKDESYKLLLKYAEDISNFSIKKPFFDTVFNDFEERQIKRKSTDWNYRYRIPTNIDELDERLGGALNGGPETGECVLWLGDSGSGKSQCLTHIGIAAARQGFRVAHFQLEGTKEQCLNRYDAAWTGTLYQDIKTGDIEQKNLDLAQRIVKKLSKRDIIVSSEESFNAKTLTSLRNELKEMEKLYGKIDVIIIDYLELLEVGDGYSYKPSEERFRQGKLAKGMKMLAMEFNAVVHTATQSSSISEEERNDPSFIITRAQLSEDKGKTRPFDIFITINQTRDESREQTMRLHTDKLREHAKGEPIHICNNFAYARFYDRKKTLNMDWEEYEEAKLTSAAEKKQSKKAKVTKEDED